MTFVLGLLVVGVLALGAGAAWWYRRARRGAAPPPGPDAGQPWRLVRPAAEGWLGSTESSGAPSGAERVPVWTPVDLREADPRPGDGPAVPAPASGPWQSGAPDWDGAPYPAEPGGRRPAAPGLPGTAAAQNPDGLAKAAFERTLRRYLDREDASLPTR